MDNHQETEVVVQKCSVKKVFLKISQNSQENTCVRVFFLIKLQACNFIAKETLAQLFSCEIVEVSNNSFLHRTPLVAASVTCSLQIFFLQILAYLNKMNDKKSSQRTV